MSKGEDRIQAILDKAKVSYVREYRIHDLRNHLYRFDFYIPSKKVAIEYEGEQHYHWVPKFFKDRSAFLNAQERSRIKMSYCLAKGIKLYCIPYWEYNNINSLKDIFQEKFLVQSKFHDDMAWSQYKDSLKIDKR
jgi:hypothetical protein